VATPLGAQQGPIQLFPKQPGATTPAAPERPGPGAAPLGAPQPGSQAGIQPGGAATTTPAPRGFQVEGLAPPEIDSIGLSGPGEGGFERTLWAGSDPELILTLLSLLPVATHNPPLAALTTRVLATGAPLDGTIAPGRVLGARVERLLAMGNLDSAKQLLDQLPPGGGDTALARLAAEAALLVGDDAGACQRAADLAPTSDAEFWAEVQIYCRLAAGDQDGARLALELLREGGHGENAAFFQLAGMVADRSEGAPPALSAPEPVELALLRLADQPVPAASIGSLSPATLTAVARSPVLAGDHQLEIAERAFQNGGLAASDLGAIYAERAPAGDALASVRSDWGPAARAMAWRAAKETEAPADLAALLDATWRAAQGEERLLVAEVWAPRFADLPVDRSLAASAPSAARALLGANRQLPAARWFSLLQDEVRSDSRVRRELAALTPLFALAGIGGSQAVPALDEAAVAAWRAATPAAADKAARLFALLEGIGSPVPDQAWWRELEPPLQREVSVPVSPLWRGLERAVAGQRKGEAVLFALHMLNGAPEAAHGAALTAALRALRAVGLDQEAREIAVATALAMDL
jgi:hypothetical protein